MGYTVTIYVENRFGTIAEIFGSNPSDLVAFLIGDIVERLEVVHPDTHGGFDITPARGKMYTGKEFQEKLVKYYVKHPFYRLFPRKYVERVLNAIRFHVESAVDDDARVVREYSF